MPVSSGVSKDEVMIHAKDLSRTRFTVRPLLAVMLGALSVAGTPALAAPETSYLSPEAQIDMTDTGSTDQQEFLRNFGDSLVLIGDGATFRPAAGIGEAIITFGSAPLRDNGQVASLVIKTPHQFTLTSLPGAVAIGKNARAGAGSITIGEHNEPFAGTPYGVASTTIGTDAYAMGHFTNVLGSFSTIRNSIPNAGTSVTLPMQDVMVNAFSTLAGSFNEQYSEVPNTSVGNITLGNVNTLTEADGAVILGDGNTLTKTRNSDGTGLALDTLYKGAYDTLETFAAKVHEGFSYDRANLVLGNSNTLNGGDTVLIAGSNRETERLSRTVVVGGSMAKVPTVLSGLTDATLLGPETQAAADLTLSVGAGASAGAEKSVAIGQGARATVAGGVAVGDGTTADRAAGMRGYDPLLATVTDLSVPAWTATGGAVSLGGRYLTGVAAGSADTDAVNVAQMRAVVENLTSASGTAQGPTVVRAADGSVIVTPVSQSGNTDYSLRLAGDVTLGADPDSNQVRINGNESTVTIGADPDKQITIDGRAGRFTFGRNISLESAAGSVRTGDVTISGATDTIDGLSNTVWRGADYTTGRAATEDQLYAVGNSERAQWLALEDDMSGLSDDVRDAGAAAAALAGLQPLAYRYDRSSQVMAALGAYRGHGALSVGLAHYAGERVLFSAGLALNAHPMVNVGLTWRFGADPQAGMSAYEADRRRALAAELERYETENSDLEAELLALDRDIGQVTAELVKLRDRLSRAQ